MIEQLHFPLESNQGFRFVVEDIQIRMRLLSKTHHYEPIKIAVETTAFGGTSLKDLADQVVDWTRTGLGVIASRYDGKFQIVTNAVIVTGKVVSPEGDVLNTPEVHNLFLGPFLKQNRTSIHLLKEAYKGHTEAAKSHFVAL